jgi:hypothetical protein
VERLWELVFEFVRLEVLERRIYPRGGDDNDRAAGWGLVEALLMCSPLEGELGGGARGGNGNRRGDQYLAYVLRRVIILGGAWRGEGGWDLLRRVWRGALAQTAARFRKDSDAEGPRGATDRAARCRAEEWRRVERALERGELWDRVGEGEWGQTRKVLGGFADTATFPLQSHLILCPPELLRNLQRHGVSGGLITRGCDEVLLLTGGLLERYLGHLPSPERRRNCLLNLLSDAREMKAHRVLALHR